MNAQAQKKTRVLVVDDSRLMCAQISKILRQDDEIEVVGMAHDGLEALDMIEALRPDVITLDVEMPRMNGLTALKHIMVRYAIPTVMISALTREGAKTTFDAFKYGAIDVIAKPSRREDEDLSAQRQDIVNKVKRAADIRTDKSRYVRMAAVDVSAKARRKGAPDASTRVVGIGAGTGGYYSLLKIIPGLSADFKGVIVAVVLAASRYVEPFITYLDQHSKIPVMGPKSLANPQKGACYVCAGEDLRVVCEKSEKGIRFRVTKDGGRDDGALDALLKSLASAVGDRAVGIVLSGPGTDGAEGIAEIRKSGGIGVVQDITNCMDPSMPLAVLEKGSVEKILPDFLLAEFLTGLNSH